MTFKNYENLHLNDSIALSEALDNLKVNADGLIAAIAQDVDSKDVLMMAWMNRQAIEETLQTGQVCYWSRSRQTYWRKGESSGNRQKLVSMSFDCDGDALLMQVTQLGAACHTNRPNCFYLKVCGDQIVIDQEKL